MPESAVTGFARHQNIQQVLASPIGQALAQQPTLGGFVFGGPTLILEHERMAIWEYTNFVTWEEREALKGLQHVRGASLPPHDFGRVIRNWFLSRLSELRRLTVEWFHYRKPRLTPEAFSVVIDEVRDAGKRYKKDAMDTFHEESPVAVPERKRLASELKRIIDLIDHEIDRWVAQLREYYYQETAVAGPLALLSDNAIPHDPRSVHKYVNQVIRARDLISRVRFRSEPRAPRRLRLQNRLRTLFPRGEATPLGRAKAALSKHPLAHLVMPRL